jgi:uncharacterized protein
MKRFCAIGLVMLLAASSLAANQSPLAAAAEQSDHATLRTLLRQPTDVNAAQADGMTALHWAALRDDLDAAQALVEARANVAVTNRYGVTPLSLACQNGSAELVHSHSSPTQTKNESGL